MEEIQTSGAPAFEDYPLSQAIRHGNTLYVSGNVPVDPDTGEIVEGDMQVQAEQTLDNISAILEEAGTSFDDVVKVNVYLTNRSDFAAFNEVYTTYLEEPFPARTALVTDLMIDVDIEVECVAEIP